MVFMKKFKILAWVIFVFFFSLCILDLILESKGIQMNFQFWSSFESIFILVVLVFISGYLLYMIYIRSKFLKIIGSIFSLFFIGFFLLLSSFDSGKINKIENEEYTVYIDEYRFLFGGEDTLYLKKNAFYSVKIGSFNHGEDNSVTYKILEDKIEVLDRWYHYPEEDIVNTYYIQLD